MEPHLLNHRLKTETLFVLLPEQPLGSAVITASHSGQDNYGYDDIQRIDDKRSVSLIFQIQLDQPLKKTGFI